MPKYSIITPVYNSFNLMEKYFHTLGNQTYKDFEVIIVDDCSSDGSYTRLKDFQNSSDLNMIVCQTKQNAGPGEARNLGMDRASGEWITFIDNDDWIDINLLQIIDNIIVTNEVNCVIYDYFTTNEKETRIARSMYSGNSGKLSVSECIKNVRNHTFGKFYKLSLCRKKNIRFPEIRRCEDVAFVCRAIEACGKPYYLHESLYYYYQRLESLSNNKKLDEKEMLVAFNILEDALGSEYQKELEEKSVPDLLYGVLLMMCKSGKKNKEIRNYINRYETKYPNWFATDIMNKMGKAKKMFLLLAKSRNIIVMKQLAFIHSKLIGR